LVYHSQSHRESSNVRSRAHPHKENDKREATTG